MTAVAPSEQISLRDQMIKIVTDSGLVVRETAVETKPGMDTLCFGDPGQLVTSAFHYHSQAKPADVIRDLKARIASNQITHRMVSTPESWAASKPSIPLAREELALMGC